MSGLGDAMREEIDNIVDSLFDRMAVNLIGARPGAEKKKQLIIGIGGTHTLANLFIQAMGNRQPLPKEAETLKTLLNTAHGFIDALKAKTKARLGERLDSYAMETRSKGERPDLTAMRAVVVEELKQSGDHFKVIAESESTKAKNVGKLMQITRVAADMGVKDPLVFFQTAKDNSVCSECVRLHTVDGSTPRVWRLSEVGYGYHKKGEQNPKFAGLHPHCKCGLSYLSPGFGFKNGRVAYIAAGHDEHRAQNT